MSDLVTEWLDAPAAADSAQLAAVLDLARRFGPIWPQTPAKTGYRGTNGSKDATRDEARIRRWWTRHPESVPALLTGEPSGVVAIDVDIKGGRNGLDTLEALGVPFHPMTVTAHTPSGGIHLLFRWPGGHVATSTDKLGPGLEVKGDGAWVTLPPGPGRFWDPHLGPDTPLAPLPEWAIISSKAEPQRDRQARPSADLSRYAEAALDAAAKHIIGAPAGAQETTLNGEAFSIGQLAGGGVIPAGPALDGLLWAARRMPSLDPRRPWSPAEIEKKVKAAFTDGLREPRTAPDARR